MEKVEITKEQALFYNEMFRTLCRIGSYDSVDDMEEGSESCGLDREEYLEMAYDNMRGEATTILRYAPVSGILEIS